MWAPPIALAVHKWNSEAASETIHAEGKPVCVFRCGRKTNDEQHHEI